jgi:hypothetical protein
MESNISANFIATPTTQNRMNLIVEAFLEDSEDNDDDEVEEALIETQSSIPTTVQVQQSNIQFSQSYIPKYIVRRFFPENGVARIQNGGLGITMKNVIAPGNAKNFGFYAVECKTERNNRRYENYDPNLQIYFQGRLYNNAQFKESNLFIPVGSTVVIFLSDYPNDNSYSCKLKLQSINPLNPSKGTTIELDRNISGVQTLDSLTQLQR